jgi:putative anti-sigma factor
MQEEIEDILIRRLSGEYLSEEEKLCFEVWYRDEEHQAYYRDLQKIRSGVLASSVAGKIDKGKAWLKVRPVRKKRVIYRVIGYAAMFVLPLGVALALLLPEKQNEKITYTHSVVLPGKKMATLTLSTGEQVALTDSLPRLEERGMVISHSEEKALVYNQVQDSIPAEVVYNAVTVPRGGEYKLALSDGTIVWLNSDSYIRYPVRFSGNTRQVELRGEAYFEVAKNSEKPFIVRMKEYNIRVTGTQFNARSYSNEETATTLVQGSVQIEKGGSVSKLSPGQQAILKDGQVQVRKVDVESYIAWRTGDFSFTQCRLENILDELARWYDVDVFYMNQQVKDYHFSAWFKRSSSISEVIAILEKTKKISLDLKGRMLTVKDNSRN